MFSETSNIKKIIWQQQKKELYLDYLGSRETFEFANMFNSEFGLNKKSCKALLVLAEKINSSKVIKKFILLQHV